ncbi:four helix bundle protein [Candidatus Gottesmanbacteria bacterium]|nr:four helix bundle protein [Candidatus Gottesmanbacteria bacterium]
MKSLESPNGYIFLIPWANANILRIFVVRFTNSLPKSNYRFKNQIDDAARSVVANIEEGFTRPTTSEYLKFLGFSQASLTEVKGDIQRARQDGLLKSISGSNLTELDIDLKSWHEKLKVSVISKPAGAREVRGIYRSLEDIRGEVNNNTSSLQIPIKSFKFLYPQVDNLKVKDLTYEFFIEIVNKTDWHLRRLVESLENKLIKDKKYYQVEQARIRGKVRRV